MTSHLSPLESCCCCGSSRLASKNVLWPELIREWEILPAEVQYINRQQGLTCLNCKCNLRAMAIAKAIMMTYRYTGTFDKFVKSWKVRRLRVLEINKAGNLTQFFKKMKNHTLLSYPEIDMMNMEFDSESVDLIIHSDTLEHVSKPDLALKECFRVLKSGGYCIFTVPLIVHRLSRSRLGMDLSFHGDPSIVESDYIVQTEYGVDIWTEVIASGFQECRIFSVEYPASQAIIGVKY